MASLRERIEQLEPREQKLVLAFGTVVAVMVVLLIPILLRATASSRKSDNEAIRDAMNSIEAARPMLEEQEAVRQTVLARYARPTPPLAGFLEMAAKAHSVEIPESQDRPPIPHGKKYTERSTKINLQKVGMKNLALFLETIETSGFPVRVSGLNLRKRMEPDSWDASLIISAFDRKEPEKKAAPEGSSETKEEAP